MTIERLSNSTCLQNLASDFLTAKVGPHLCTDQQIKALSKQAMENLKAAYLKNIISAKLQSKDQQFAQQAFDKVLVSAKTPWTPHLPLESLTTRQKMILQILQGNVPPLKELLKDRTLLAAILWKKNPQLLDEAKDLVQKILSDLNTHLKNPHLTESDSFHIEMIIGDLLSLYPFLGPKNRESLHVPIRVNNEWLFVEYKVEKIFLTPPLIGSPITDYGLTAPDAPPLLLFKGTTYPTDKGFALSLLTDLNPFGSVGAYAFGIGKKKIQIWLENNCSNQKALVFGKSLGGAHAWQSALTFPNQVQKVMAYGAPGFSLFDLDNLKKLKKQNKLPEINIFCQENDPFPYFDWAAKEGVNYYQVIGSKIRKGIIAHADMYSTHEKCIILKTDPNISGKATRIVSTTFRGVLSFAVFPPVLLLHIICTVAGKSLHQLRKAFHKKPANFKNLSLTFSKTGDPAKLLETSHSNYNSIAPSNNLEIV